MPSEKKTCFVIMGYGKKTDYQTGRVLDLDAAYRNMIKPAVEAAGLKCVRADEIVHSGVIDVPMYQQLMTADVVIADLSTYNCNAFYELGVRHALRPFTTITIAEEKLVYPFDVNHIVIRRYKHLGDDIGVAEAKRFTAEMKKAITTVLKNPASDSPVYEFLRNLTPPMLKDTVDAMAGSAKKSGSGKSKGKARTASAGVRSGSKTLSTLMTQADEAQRDGDFIAAKKYLTAARELMRPSDDEREEDPYLIQRLALVTYKSKQPTVKKALENARALLTNLKPKISNDTETLGLWGAVHKRLWEETKDRPHLDEGIRAYERGFNLRNDYYNGINLAYLLNVRASERKDAAEAIADFVQARRVRHEVVTICEGVLQDPKLPADEKYWVLATMAEAFMGMENKKKGQQLLKKAHKAAPAEWMWESTREQIVKLEDLLTNSPLRHVVLGG